MAVRLEDNKTKKGSERIAMDGSVMDRERQR